MRKRKNTIEKALEKAQKRGRTRSRVGTGGRLCLRKHGRLPTARAVREAMTSAMRDDPEVFLMGEDVGVYGGAFGVSRGMVEEFGEDRIVDTPISEAGYVGLGVGAALMGMRPILEIQFSDFITHCMDQLVNQAAKLRYMFGGEAEVPLVLRTPGGAGTGAAAQHSQSLEAWFYSRTGAQGRHAFDPVRRQGDVAGRPRRPEPGDLLRA